MDHPLISEARRIGQAEGAVAVAMVIISPNGDYAIVTWGETKTKCAAMKSWGRHLGSFIEARPPSVANR